MENLREEEEKKTRNLVLSVCELKHHGTLPTPRIGAQMVSLGTKFFLHGGADTQKCFGDLYRLEIEKTLWTALSVSGFSKPSPRYGHSLKGLDKYLILFGGFTSVDEESDTKENKTNDTPIFEGFKNWNLSSSISNELYFLDAESITWSKPDCTEEPPCPRAFHASTCLPHFLCIHGGTSKTDLSESLNDMYFLNVDTKVWYKAEQTGEVPSPRYGHQIVFATAPSKTLYLFGGHGSENTLYTCNIENLETSTTEFKIEWNIVKAMNTAPLCRIGFAMNVIGDRIFIAAGQTETAVSDLYIFEILNNRWCKPLFDGNLNIVGHSAGAMHDKLVIFGGATWKNERNDTLNSAASETSNKQLQVTNTLRFMSILRVNNDASDGDFKFKFVIVGDSGVGKSCLLTRFVQDVYMDCHVASIGIDFKSVMTMAKGKVCCLRLWDTAGQERFSNLTSNYYRSADGFVLVYDATRRQSFEHIDFWIKQILEHHECGPWTVKLVIGNKYDLVDQIEVLEAEGRSYAQKLNAFFVAASAKTSYQVDAAFLMAANRMVEYRRKALLARSSQLKADAKTANAIQDPNKKITSTLSALVEAAEREESTSGSKKKIQLHANGQILTTPSRACSACRTT